MPTSHQALLTLALALSIGLILIVVSRRLKLPTLVFLLGGGVLCGPQGLGILDPDSLGDFLPVVVSLAVAIILFEGGLMLDIKGYLKGSTVIKRLLSLGVIITWLGAAAAVKFFLHTGWPLALLTGSLVIVTGPTVIAPLLKRIRIQPRLHHILQWEGVLIDSIGVFIALLCLEWVTAQSGHGGVAMLNFGIRTATGVVLGVSGGWGIYLALKYRLAPDNMVNGFSLALAVLLFGLSETIQPDAGLLSVTLAGLIVGWKRPVDLQKIREFKGELTELLIGLLFMLLSARLDLGQFKALGLPGILAVVTLLVIVRPLSIVLCTWGSDLTWRERVFLGWIAPRGIVAASMASLFALALARDHAFVFNPRFVETFTYSVIIATVVLQGFTAGTLAWALRLKRPPARGWLILGAHGFARRVAAFIDSTGDAATLIDRNPLETSIALRENLVVISGDALEPEPLIAQHDLVSVGRLIALTDNSDLNELACHRWSEHILRDHLYRWSTDGSARTHHATHGQPVWNELPRPGQISAELLSGASTLEELLVDDPVPLPPQAIPLLLARDGHVRPVANRRPTLKKGDRLLFLRRTGSYLANALSAGVVVDMPASASQAPYLELIEALRTRHPSLDAKAVSAELQRRVVSFPFDVGRGVSVPHAYAPGLLQRVCLLARDRSFGNLTFLVLSPHADADSHLATLNEIARICDVPADRQALLEAPDLPSLVALTRNFAQSQ